MNKKKDNTFTAIEASLGDDNTQEGICAVSCTKFVLIELHSIKFEGHLTAAFLFCSCHTYKHKQSAVTLLFLVKVKTSFVLLVSWITRKKIPTSVFKSTTAGYAGSAETTITRKRPWESKTNCTTGPTIYRNEFLQEHWLFSGRDAAVNGVLLDFLGDDGHGYDAAASKRDNLHETKWKTDFGCPKMAHFDFFELCFVPFYWPKDSRSTSSFGFRANDGLIAGQVVRLDRNPRGRHSPIGNNSPDKSS